MEAPAPRSKCGSSATSTCQGLWPPPASSSSRCWGKITRNTESSSGSIGVFQCRHASEQAPLRENNSHNIRKYFLSPIYRPFWRISPLRQLIPYFRLLLLDREGRF